MSTRSSADVISRCSQTATAKDMSRLSDEDPMCQTVASVPKGYGSQVFGLRRLRRLKVTESYTKFEASSWVGEFASHDFRIQTNSNPRPSIPKFKKTQIKDFKNSWPNFSGIQHSIRCCDNLQNHSGTRKLWNPSLKPFLTTLIHSPPRTPKIFHEGRAFALFTLK